MKDETKKISKNRQKKEALVAEMAEKVAKAKAIVLTNYQSMTHQQIETLKKGLKKVNAELSVTKNTLLKIALGSMENGSRRMENDASFQQPTAALFAYGDVAAPLKELAKSIKLLRLPKIKIAFMDGAVLSETDVLKLSALPSKEVLLAQLIGALQSPLYGLRRSLNWNLQKFVMTLKAIETTKEDSG